MGTVAINPLSPPGSPEKSSLPLGGNPRWDRAYSEWLAGFVEEQAPTVLDALTGPDGEIPPWVTRRLLEHDLGPYAISHHLYRVIVGWPFPDGTGPVWLHRLRFLAIQLNYRREELEAEAIRYVRDKLAALKAEHTGS